MPLTLQRVIGLSTDSELAGARPLCRHPSGALVYAVGRSVVIHDLASGAQRILSGHTRPITTVDCSPDGKYILSGQEDDGSGNSAVCVWEFSTGEPRVMPAFRSGVRCARFSPDSRFVAACAREDGGVACWEADTGSLVGKFTARDGRANTFVAWQAPTLAEAGRPRPSLVFVSADHNRLYKHKVSFDRAALAYVMDTQVIDVPPTGVQRDFTCGVVAGDFILCGSPAGEMMVFSLTTGVFRQIVKYFKAPVTEIVVLAKSWSFDDCRSISLCSADGDMISIFGSDNMFTVTAEMATGFPLACLVVDPESLALLAIGGQGGVLRFPLEQAGVRGGLVDHSSSEYLNRNGNVGELPGQRGFTNTLPAGRRQLAQVGVSGSGADALVLAKAEASLILSFPSYPLVRAVTLAPGRTQKDIGKADPANCYLVGATAHGTVHVWDAFGGLGLLASAQPGPATVAVSSLCACGSRFYAGLESGAVSGFEFTRESGLRQLFTIPVAHKREVSAMGASPDFLVTGGDDGQLFLWDAATGQLLSRITEHFSRVLCVAFDLLVPTMIHVSLADGYISTHDFKNRDEPRRLKNRVLPGHSGGAATAIQQVPCGRYEVAATCLDGVIRFFDFDVQEPVQEVLLPEGVYVGPRAKYLLSLTEDRLVAAGCEFGGDEVMMVMEAGEKDWVPVETELTNGLQVCSVSFAGPRTVAATGARGEIFVYELENAPHA